MDDELLELGGGGVEEEDDPLLDELLGGWLLELLPTELDDEETDDDEPLLELGTLEEEDEPLAEPLELDGCGVGVTGGRCGFFRLRGRRRSCRRRFGLRSARAVFFCRLRFISKKPSAISFQPSACWKLRAES